MPLGRNARSPIAFRERVRLRYASQQFASGHTGKELMIIKRLMALIALASSAALAQQQPGDGNVPAPDLFE